MNLNSLFHYQDRWPRRILSKFSISVATVWRVLVDMFTWSICDCLATTSVTCHQILDSYPFNVVIGVQGHQKFGHSLDFVDLLFGCVGIERKFFFWMGSIQMNSLFRRRFTKWCWRSANAQMVWMTLWRATNKLFQGHPIEIVRELTISGNVGEIMSTVSIIVLLEERKPLVIHQGQDGLLDLARDPSPPQVVDYEVHKMGTGQSKMCIQEVANKRQFSSQGGHLIKFSEMIVHSPPSRLSTSSNELIIIVREWHTLSM